MTTLNNTKKHKSGIDDDLRYVYFVKYLVNLLKVRRTMKQWSEMSSEQVKNTGREGPYRILWLYETCRLRYCGLKEQRLFVYIYFVYSVVKIRSRERSKCVQWEWREQVGLATRYCEVHYRLGHFRGKYLKKSSAGKDGEPHLQDDLRREELDGECRGKSWPRRLACTPSDYWHF